MSRCTLTGAFATSFSIVGGLGLRAGARRRGVAVSGTDPARGSKPGSHSWTVMTPPPAMPDTAQVITLAGEEQGHIVAGSNMARRWAPKISFAGMLYCVPVPAPTLVEVP